MRLFIRRLVRTVLILIVLGVAANDGLKTAAAFSRASDAMAAGMSAARAQVSAAPSDIESARAAADAAAQAQNATLSSYSQVTLTQGSASVVRISLSASEPVSGTIVAPAILGVLNGTPSDEWYAPGSATITVGQTKEVEVYGGTTP